MITIYVNDIIAIPPTSLLPAFSPFPSSSPLLLSEVCDHYSTYTDVTGPSARVRKGYLHTPPEVNSLVYTTSYNTLLQ